ncbi:MAG: CO dehydrogenase/acetyl-CoA synthase subunit delta [Methanospirillum sp.]|nr:CO dehydrogenase/acetyl-CoA synthase subunit delta [Methanospirillum sp.]
MNGRDLVGALGPELLALLRTAGRIELEGFSLELDELEFRLPHGALAPAALVPPGAEAVPERPSDLLEAEYVPERTEYPGRIREVVLGATRREGGSRARALTVGGAEAPAFSLFDRPIVNRPVISMDVFDTRVPMPKALRAPFEEVRDDPAAWARLNVHQFGAKAITVHLLSTDPLIKNTSPRKAAATVEEVLQAVDVPLIIGGCGDPRKDADVFFEVAAMASGERLLLNSVTLEMATAKTLEKVARAAAEHGHNLLAFTGLELNDAKELNRRLYEYVPPEQIVMDLTTVALGYGLEYSFSIHERARQAALMGDAELQHPTISGSTNAWSAREAWMPMPPTYGGPERRGPLWEAETAIALLLAGVDIFMMSHPAAIGAMREALDVLTSWPLEEVAEGRANDWVTAAIGGET